MPVITATVAASADDAWSDSGSGFAILNGNGYFLGTGNLSSSPDRTGGWRFQLTGPASGDTINSAYIQVKSVWYSSSADPSFEFVGDDVDNAAAWDGGSHIRNQITPTTATVTTSGSFTADSGTYQRLGSSTLDLSPIIQEIVDRAGWSSGNYIRIVASGTGPGNFNAVEYRAYDGYPSDAPQLVVDYTAGGGGATYTLDVDAGIYTVTGQNPALLAGRALAIDAGLYSVTGNDLGLLVSRVLTLDAGSYTVSGHDLGLLVNRLIAIDAGNYGVTGYDVGLLASRLLAIDAGSYTVTGNDPALLVNRVLTLDAGNYAVTGYDVTLDYSGAGAPTYTLNIDTGLYSVTGHDPGLAAARLLNIDAGSYSVTGQDVGLLVGRVLTIDAGSYTVTGQDLETIISRVLNIDAGTYTITGRAVTLDYSGAVAPVIQVYTVNLKTNPTPVVLIVSQPSASTDADAQPSPGEDVKIG